MADTSDDLDGFFSEINQIEAEVSAGAAAGSGEGADNYNDSVPPGQDAAEEHVAKKPRGPQVIASAPVLNQLAGKPMDALDVYSATLSSSSSSSSASSSSSSSAAVAPYASTSSVAPSSKMTWNPLAGAWQSNDTTGAGTGGGGRGGGGGWKPPQPHAPQPQHLHGHGQGAPPLPKQDQKFVRTGAGEVWVDDTLQDWPDGDFRIFVGDLGKVRTCLPDRRDTETLLLIVLCVHVGG
jgi:hypothetical protein